MNLSLSNSTPAHLEIIKNAVANTISEDRNIYNFETDSKIGLAFEHLAQRTFISLYGIKYVKKCVDHELGKDYKGLTNDGLLFDIEVKGDIKSVCTDNLFFEYYNTALNRHSGVTCGNPNCIWVHFFFNKDKTDRMYALLTSKKFLMDTLMKYKDDTRFIQPKEIQNARG
ncbi:MAG: hypothetical protein ACRDD8_15305, partial [Bacteroidales bacterium]